MCNIKLKPHNEVAYRKVKEQFESSNKACVIHATGTGKSFIIAATAEDYDKVLVLAPNNYVLSELDKTVGNNCTLMTYAKLSTIEEINDLKFDLIVLDEFHRTGAEVWGASVTKLLSVNPDTKVLGTTATEIRTEGRNMADEMFDGNVVSRLTLPMAWSQGILKVPVYVTGLYTFDNIDNDMRSKIMKSNKTNEEKAISLAELDSIKLDWINSRGTDKIIKKYINPNSRRIIVFCDKIKNITTMKRNIKVWLNYAGLKVNKIYSVNSGDSNSDKAMEEFENDNFTGIKVMMAVNMLNEGVHVPKVDALIMLRPTSSNIIYKQQMGRCMSISNESSPVIFDLVDNLSNSSYLTNLHDELEKLEIEGLSVKERDVPGPKDPVAFNIIDYMHDTRNLIEKLDEEYSINFHSFEENLNELKEFVKEHKRLPYDKNEKDEVRLSSFIKYYKSNHEIIEIIEQYSRKGNSFEENLNELKEFVKEHKKLPRSGNGKDEGRLRSFINNYRSNPEIIEIVNQYSRKGNTFDENLKKLKEFVKKHKRLPQDGHGKDEGKLRVFIRRYKSNHEIIEIVNQFPRKDKSFEENLNELKEFVKKYNRLPQSCNHGKDEGRLKGFINRYKSNSEIIGIVEKYRRK